MQLLKEITFCQTSLYHYSKKIMTALRNKLHEIHISTSPLVLIYQIYTADCWSNSQYPFLGVSIVGEIHYSTLICSKLPMTAVIIE